MRKLQRKGGDMSRIGDRQRFICNECGAPYWVSGFKDEIPEGELFEYQCPHCGHGWAYRCATTDEE